MPRTSGQKAFAVPVRTVEALQTQLREMAAKPRMVEGKQRFIQQIWEEVREAVDAGYGLDEVVEAAHQMGIELKKSEVTGLVEAETRRREEARKVEGEVRHSSAAGRGSGGT
jgi:hypothetical protein